MFTTSFTVEWGDCDEAGIAYYPNYFYWIDCTFHRLLRARGVSQRELKRRFGAVTPVTEVGAEFTAPLTYDDQFEITARISEWQDRRFRLIYEVERAHTRVASLFEARAWAIPDETGRLRGTQIPEEFRRLVE